LVPGGSFALLGTTMAPGFDFADFELGDRARLAADYPAFAEWVRQLTR
jgi:predicted cupin superfamily sugar epimerase